MEVNLFTNRTCFTCGNVLEFGNANVGASGTVVFSFEEPCSPKSELPGDWVRVG